MKFLRCFAFFVMLHFGTLAGLAQDTWEWRSPTPSGNRLGSFAYGNGLFVGVGENGAILTSPDGATWTNRESGANVKLQRVVFDGTRFVTVGGMNILTSTNGATWTAQTASAELVDVAYGNGTFVAISSANSSGNPNRFLTSSSGTSWTLRDNLTDVSPRRVLFANGVFVAADDVGHVLRSTDGINWTPLTLTSLGGNMQCAAGNSVFVVSFYGHTFRSTDGIVWVDVLTTATSHPRIGLMGTLGFANGRFYADEGHHGHGVFSSTDGTAWTQVGVAPDSEQYGAYFLDFTTLASGGGATVATESISLFPGGNVNPLGYYTHHSTTGLPGDTTWSSQFSNFNYYADGHALYGLGRYFLGGKSSPDGMTWTDCGFSPTHAAGDRLFRIVSSANGTILPEITSRYGAITTVEISADGLTSTAIDVHIPTPRAVAFGAGRYVMVGENGKISTSTNGLDWALTNSTTAKNLNGIIFAFNRFVAVGDGGTLLSSMDGVTWTANGTSPGNIHLQQIAASADRVVITGESDELVPASTTLVLDGTATPIAVSAGHRYTGLTFFNGVFLAVSYEPRAPPEEWRKFPQLWKSADGVSWTEIIVHVGPTGYYEFPPALASGNGTAIFHAGPGSLQTSPIYHAILQTPYVGANAPTVTYPPVSINVHRGETATFAVGATGSGPFTYQWYHDGAAIAGATKSVLSLNLITDTAAGDYTVVVTNSVGSATSTAGHLTVVAPIPLTITEQPVGGSLYEFQPLFLHVAVTGSGPYTYQWRRNGVPIPLANSATYEIWTSSYSIDNYTGNYDVVVSAPYSSATSQTAVVTRGAPSVTLSSLAPIAIDGGSTLRITATATGVGPFTYRWFVPGANGSLIGATSPTLILPFVTADDSSVYSVEVTDANGQKASASVIVYVRAPASPQTSGTATASPGQDLTFRAGFIDPTGYSFQWRFNGVAIPGATGASYTVHSFSSVNEGSYDVVVTGPDGTISTRSVIQLVLEGSRLVNLSARGFAGTGEDTLIQGFVLRGAPSGASPNVLVRSVGPTLSIMGVPGTLTDPSIRVLDTKQTLVAVNDNWSTVVTTGRGIAATSADMAQFGAFALPADSRDSAVLVHEAPASPYTALVSSVTNSTGIVLNEIYGPTSGTQRLVNLSARARVGSGDNILIGGFVISGTAPLKVLIRGVGPTLASQGIAVPLTNPKITLFNRAGVEIHNNDNWGQAANLADLRAATTAVGAFALNENSHDAAMLETLDSGVYTVHVTSADGTNGVALVEIYEVP